jgi:hypothetical protein
MLSGAAAILMVQTGCASTRTQVLSFPIGQKVQVGILFYQVLEAAWMTEVEGAKHPPKNRILGLHMTVTNSGANEAALPFLRLIDARGKELMELSEIEGNPHWLGALRRMKPALTEEGFVYFDVPIGAYKLEVVDNSNPEDERVAYIEIPASLAPPAQAPGANGI